MEAPYTDNSKKGVKGYRHKYATVAKLRVKAGHEGTLE
jgi:hypothetical protein